VIKTKTGISKIYFVELPKDVQERFGYNPEKAAEKNTKEAIARSWQKTDVTEPLASSGIETLSPITVKLKDEILNALKMTDKLDALYKRGCSSAEFIAAATPIESVFLNLHKQLPKGDPGRDLLANTFEAYQQTAIAMTANEQGKAQRPDAIIAAAAKFKVNPQDKQRFKTLREERVDIDDVLFEREFAACALERVAKAGGNGSKPPPVRFCECLETVVNGRRIAAPEHHDCSYVRARSLLVPEASRLATDAVGDPTGNKLRGRAWTVEFNRQMTRLGAPLYSRKNLQQSGVPS
jgi:hypothetical protein